MNFRISGVLVEGVKVFGPVLASISAAFSRLNPFSRSVSSRRHKSPEN